MYKHPNLDNSSAGNSNKYPPALPFHASFGIQTDAPEVTIIKKKKSPVSFERRFLSAVGKGDNCILEVAMIWRGNVMGIHQYPAKNGFEVCIGETEDCQYHVNLDGNHGKYILASCGSDGRWLLHHRCMNGFILDKNMKIPFEKTHPESAVSGDIRAKYIFGEVSILVHYVEKKTWNSSCGVFRMNRYGALVASILLHFALFSVILFTTDRVDALMVDRMLTTARFAVMVESEVEVAEEKEEIAEEVSISDAEEVMEDAVVARESYHPSPVANAAPASGRGPMTKSEAASAAQSAGLLTQASVMNSLLASAQNLQNFDASDWTHFDSAVNAPTQGYVLTATGTLGGGIGLGSFDGGIGPVGTEQYRAIKAGRDSAVLDLGPKKETTVHVDIRPPEVTGSLDKRQILKVVKNHTGELRNCYEKELQKNKALSGRVVLVWVISPQGDVTKVIKKESSMKNANVENCVINSVKFWRFPAPKNGGSTMIEYPFVFNVGGN